MCFPELLYTINLMVIFVAICISWLKHSGLISGENDFYGSVSSEQFLPGQRQKQVLIISINDDIPEVCIHCKQSYW